MLKQGASKASVIYVAVVDDDESARRSFSRLLRAAGFQAVTYTSAEALLGDAKRPRFVCLLLDIQLEGMSGLELSRRLAGIGDQTPVIFITAVDDPQMKSDALSVGCAGFFKKTDSADLVLEAIRRATSGGGGESVIGNQ
jgi:FixJ family two-component response regulator